MVRGSRNDSFSDVRVLAARPFELSIAMKEQIYTLLESNMRDMYTKNWSWDPKQKRAEIEHTASRFLLAVPASFNARSVRRSTRNSPNDPPLLAYIMFRCEDYDAESTDPVAVGGEATIEVAYWCGKVSNAATRCR